MSAIKLTLKIDQEVIVLGKKLAKEQKTSLSRMFEQFIRIQLKQQPESRIKNIEVNPFIENLVADIPATTGEVDFGKDKQAFYDHLNQKGLSEVK